MKKLLCMAFGTFLSVCLFLGCSVQNPDLPQRDYVFQGSSEVVKPSISLQENHQFRFSYSLLSSTLPMGSYPVSGETLTLRPDDIPSGKAVSYVFRIQENALIFDREQSTPLPALVSLADGARFS